MAARDDRCAIDLVSQRAPQYAEEDVTGMSLSVESGREAKRGSNHCDERKGQQLLLDDAY